MKITADENMDAGIIEWLRGEGCDVFSVRESMRGATDEHILLRANGEQRIILTKDMDFGEMIFFDRLPAVGVVLLRLEDAGAQKRLEAVQEHWSEVMHHASGNFVVVTKDRLRIRSLTAPPR